MNRLPIEKLLNQTVPISLKLIHLSNMIHLIKEILQVEPFTVTVRYNTGEVLSIPFKRSLQEWATVPDSPFLQAASGRLFYPSSA